MTTPDFTNATWRTSSYSASNGGECVEVAFAERPSACATPRTAPQATSHCPPRRGARY